MTKKNPYALVLCGDGINCENETAYALGLAGFDAELVHVSSLIKSTSRLDDASLLVFPGGFSFGDEIESGKVLAIKLMESVSAQLNRFVETGRLVLGICNGFQALVQMKLLPGSHNDTKKQVSLLANEGGKFINKWVSLTITGDNSEGFMRGLERIELPIRHGEGRLSVADSLKNSICDYSALKYDLDVNGSYERIAALKNEAGNVLGMMPHPEAFIRWTHHPSWTTLKVENPNLLEMESMGQLKEDDLPDGLKILKNARIMAGQLS